MIIGRKWSRSYLNPQRGACTQNFFVWRYLHNYLIFFDEIFLNNKYSSRSVHFWEKIMTFDKFKTALMIFKIQFRKKWVPNLNLYYFCYTIWQLPDTIQCIKCDFHLSCRVQTLLGWSQVVLIVVVMQIQFISHWNIDFV